VAAALLNFVSRKLKFNIATFTIIYLSSFDEAMYVKIVLAGATPKHESVIGVVPAGPV